MFSMATVMASVLNVLRSPQYFYHIMAYRCNTFVISIGLVQCIITNNVNSFLLLFLVEIYFQYKNLYLYRKKVVRLRPALPQWFHRPLLHPWLLPEFAWNLNQKFVKIPHTKQNEQKIMQSLGGAFGGALDTARHYIYINIMKMWG